MSSNVGLTLVGEILSFNNELTSWLLIFKV